MATPSGTTVANVGMSGGASRSSENPRASCRDPARRRRWMTALPPGLGACLVLGACAGAAVPMEQVPATQKSTAAFSTLAVVAPLDVTIDNADHYAVVVTGDDEAADLVRMSLEDETLSLHLDGDLSSRPTVAVSAPPDALRDLEISEAATVSTLDALTGSQLEVIVGGASSAQLATEDLRQLKVTALGGSTATVTGARQAESLDAEAAGASTLHLFDLTAADVTARASEGSTVEVTATRSLRATASEVSTLTYRGAPADITKEATEISTITSD